MLWLRFVIVVWAFGMRYGVTGGSVCSGVDVFMVSKEFSLCVLSLFFVVGNSVSCWFALVADIYVLMLVDNDIRCWQPVVYGLCFRGTEGPLGGLPFCPPEDGRETSRGQGFDVPRAKVVPHEDQRTFSGGLSWGTGFLRLRQAGMCQFFCHTRTEENNQRIRRITISVTDALMLYTLVFVGEGPFIPDGGSVPPCRRADSRWREFLS